MKGNNITQYVYQNNPVSFSSDKNIMINATEMAKPFGKRPADWTRCDSAKEFLDVLPKVKKCVLENLIQVKKGGNNPGTWMHRDVAIKFARWLSPEFAIWCNDRIIELVTNANTPVSLPSNNTTTLMLCGVEKIKIDDKKFIESLKKSKGFLSQVFFLIGEIYSKEFSPKKFTRFVE